eukprot:CAMPEP_0113954270 /NCGR_PEP_ID=MMETSP0011_2-20120614/404_1 /TAXON_ID=101924 /ORGANISM="Rhodosorus marinus" /LENGTH=92 /DNA_ID=CAMNT_0000963269 /DNA_START=42 /DNA_END=320 /DNA_ORIENTATION=+ /assembly_acc=CAM_ASM_000156
MALRCSRGRSMDRRWTKRCRRGVGSTSVAETEAEIRRSRAWERTAYGQGESTEDAPQPWDYRRHPRGPSSRKFPPESATCGTDATTPYRLDH